MEEKMGMFTVWNVNNPGYMALDGGTRKEKINLVIRISKSPEVFNTTYESKHSKRIEIFTERLRKVVWRYATVTSI